MASSEGFSLEAPNLEALNLGALSLEASNSRASSSEPLDIKVAAAEDLIIYHYETTQPLQNRWAFSSEVVDYSLVQDLSETLYETAYVLQRDQLARLKRVKICGAPCGQLTSLLTGLSIFSNGLEQIDIDKITRSSLHLTFQFVSLITLSIGFEMPFEGAVTEMRRSVEFDAPALRKLYLGESLSNSLQVISDLIFRNLPSQVPTQSSTSR